MDSGTEAPKSIFSGKAGSFFSGIGRSVIGISYGLYEKAEDASFRFKKNILEKWFSILNPVKKEKGQAWNDKRKKLILGLMNNGNGIDGQSQVENGIMGLLAIKKGAEVLELGCGDGFDSRFFFSSNAFHVTALDSDPKAIAHASKNHAAPNITYRLCDFSRDMTVGKFDTIIWNLGPEEFSKEAADKIISLAKARLNQSGIISGSSNILKNSGWLNRVTDLENILKAHFSHVKIKESGFSDGVFFFYASEEALQLI